MSEVSPVGGGEQSRGAKPSRMPVRLHALARLHDFTEALDSLDIFTHVIAPFLQSSDPVHHLHEPQAAD